MATTQTQKTDSAEIQKVEILTDYIRKPEIAEKFSLVLGNNREAMRFIQTVIITVQTADPGEYSLLNCTNYSIVRQALRAATQRVSVDPIDRQAYLIPRNNKKTGKQEANFQFHYQEIYNRAMRTNRYSVINVSPVYAGSTVFEDMYTGLHVVQIESGLLTTGHEQVSRLRPVSDKSKKRIGWLGYYRTTRGQEKTVYMTIEEIDTRAHSAPGGGMGFGWTKFRDVMEMKTVLLALLRLADLSAPGMEEVKNVLETVEKIENADSGPDLESLAGQDENIVDGEPQYIDEGYSQEQPKPAPEPVTASQEYSAAKTFIVSGQTLESRSVDELGVMLDDPKRAASTKKAIRTVLNYKVDEAMQTDKKAEQAKML